MLPKETPDDIVQAYRDAAKKMAADPEVIAFIHSELGKYDTIVDNVDKAMQTATHVSPAAEKFIPGWLKDRFGFEIGRAHVCTPVTNAHHVCRLLLVTKNYANDTAAPTLRSSETRNTSST